MKYVGDWTKVMSRSDGEYKTVAIQCTMAKCHVLV